MAVAPDESGLPRQSTSSILEVKKIDFQSGAGRPTMSRRASVEGKRNMAARLRLLWDIWARLGAGLGGLLVEGT